MAAKWAGFETVAFCECEKYAQKVLRKNFPGVPIYEDVKKLDGRQFEGLELLTGGFPCQPYSQAGKRRGEKDDRALWAEMARVIQEARPRWVLGENVAGLVSLGLDFVLSELESLGYTCEPVILPACALNAPHRRDRVWIIAHANGQSEPEGVGQFAPHPSSEGGQRRKAGVERLDSQLKKRVPGRSDPRNVSNSNGERNCGWPPGGQDAENAGKPSKSERNNEPRLEAWHIEPNVGRVAHGVPRRMDRLRGLGNAIVPQVAYELLRLMK